MKFEEVKDVDSPMMGLMELQLWEELFLLWAGALLSSLEFTYFMF